MGAVLQLAHRLVAAPVSTLIMVTHSPDEDGRATGSGVRDRSNPLGLRSRCRLDPHGRLHRPPNLPVTPEAIAGRWRLPGRLR
jgi:hypothetical protein